MSRGHWLDPLARKLLQAVGDLPPDPPVRPPGRNGASQADPLEPTWVIDVNRARAEDWQLLPGCSDSMIDLLLRLQRGGVQFSQADDLFQLLELPSLQAEEWRPHLIFRWHGDAPPLEDNRALDFNAASHQELQQRLQWHDTRFNRLIEERIRRPFENLADLQERLCLPPETIEGLLGKARFGSRRAGPSLPPRASR